VIKDTVVGKGAAAKKGDKVTVNYTGYLTDGKKFDSSIGRAPFSFALGGGQVIPGWDQGVVGMKVGGKRTLTIPADLGYGAQGTPDGTIPPNSTLVFDIEMLKIN
jgi:peptidylprolyl isomerase/FKBP-type peptidyl-prolyl cis-trans isomerase FkpA